MLHPLLTKVRSVKHSARRVVVAHGVLVFLAVSILAAFAVGFTDYLFRFQDRGWRVTGSTLVGAALVWAFARFVYPSVAARHNNVQIARHIERRFPQLADQLSTAVSFLEHSPSDPYAGSPLLRQATIDAAARAVHELPLHACLDARVLRRAGLGLLAVVALVAGSCALDLEASSRAARRLVMPLSSETWPRHHALEFVQRPRRLAEGSAFEVEVVDRRGQLPERVVLQYWVEGSGPESLQEKPMKPWGNRMLARLENVSHSFRYRAVGGDDDTMDWIPLEVVRPPQLTALRIRLVPPAYTRLPPELSGRHLRGWAGTRVEMSGRMDKPLHSLTVVTECGGTRRRLPAAVARDGHRFTLPASGEAPWILQSSGTYLLELQDASNFVSEELGGSEIHVQEDTPPTVSLAAPPANSQYAANASVPLRIVAKDDLAIRTIELERGDARIELYRAPETNHSRRWRRRTKPPGAARPACSTTPGIWRAFRV